MEEIKIDQLKTLTFDGREEKWREWSQKFLVKARVQGFGEVLLTDLGVPSEIKKNDELTEQERKIRRQNELAYSALLLSCEGAAFRAVERAVTEDLPTGDARQAWENLTTTYANNKLQD